MENILVSDVMTRNPITVKSDATLLECARQMVRKRVSSLLIIDKERLVGFISQKDILWALVKKQDTNVLKVKAIDLSPKKIATIKPSVPVKEAIKRMNKLKFDKLPVVSEGKVLGIVTVKDVLGFHPEIYPEFEEYAKVREEQEKIKTIKRVKELAVTNDGICEECGNRGALYRVHGMLVCEACRGSI